MKWRARDQSVTAVDDEIRAATRAARAFGLIVRSGRVVSFEHRSSAFATSSAAPASPQRRRQWKGPGPWNSSWRRLGDEAARAQLCHVRVRPGRRGLDKHFVCRPSRAAPTRRRRLRFCALSRCGRSDQSFLRQTFLLPFQVRPRGRAPVDRRDPWRDTSSRLRRGFCQTQIARPDLVPISKQRRCNCGRCCSIGAVSPLRVGSR